MWPMCKHRASASQGVRRRCNVHCDVMAQHSTAQHSTAQHSTAQRSAGKQLQLAVGSSSAIELAGLQHSWALLATASCTAGAILDPSRIHLVSDAQSG